MSVRYFQAEPSSMPEDVFDEHHILLNLQPVPHRVQNMRNGEQRASTFNLHDIFVTPASTRSGWRWFAKSNAIVNTLKPQKVEKFAQSELGMLLEPEQSFAKNSAACWFADQAHFSRSFKKITGQTPKEVRAGRVSDKK